MFDLCESGTLTKIDWYVTSHVFIVVCICYLSLKTCLEKKGLGIPYEAGWIL